MFAELLPVNMAVAETTEHLVAGSLFASEAASVAAAAVARQDEFRAGRLCARTAMAQLGLPAQPIPIGPDRGPVWPPGVVGSITHAAGLVAAVVAWRHEYVGVGIDIEAAGDLGDDVTRHVATPEELASARQVVPDSAAAALVFSAKESLYKVWAPLAGTFLDFHQATVRFAHDGTVRAEVHIAVTNLPRELPRILCGRYRYEDERVLTAIFVAR